MHDTDGQMVAQRCASRRTLAICVIVALTLVLIGPLFVSWVKVAVGWPSETTSIWQYSQIRKQWAPELAGHFPEGIPESARHVRLSACPGFLQGGAHFQVAYCLSADEINLLLTGFRSRGKAIYQGGSGFDHYNKDNENGLPIAEYLTSSIPHDRSFPQDFTVIVLGARAYSYHNGTPNWNHGHSYGVAISLLRSRVVYWAEDW